MIELRPYQQACVDAVYHHLRTRDDNPCAVVPTAGGKTPIMATICKDAVGQWGGRVLVLAHVKELLQQTAGKLRAVCPEVESGVYSAGLGRRDMTQPVIVAGIQSIYKRACEFDPFDLILVDEAHLIPAEGEGMYRQFLADAKVINPQSRIVGFTATPYRLKSGLICSEKHFLNTICYEVGVRELIRDGYLCPLITKAGVSKADFSGLHTRAGEFVADEVESLMDGDVLVDSACTEIVAQTKDRNAVLIFASGMKHGQHIVETLATKYGIECGFVSGETPTAERDELLARFRGDQQGLFAAKPLKYLCNVNVLTTGFDAPHIDCVAILRPTLSPGLYYQMVGRGFRLHPSKFNCLILDYGGNVLRHGPVDELTITGAAGSGGGVAPAKECPQCQALIATGYAVCPQCGHEFPPPERQKHEAKASDAGILKGQVKVEQHEVLNVVYSVHQKRGAGEDAPKSMRVEYEVGFAHYVSEWICVEHDGYALRKAADWWLKHSPDPMPETAEEAVRICEGGGVAWPSSITVRYVAGERFPQVTDHELGPMPDPLVEHVRTGPPMDDEDIPF